MNFYHRQWVNFTNIFRRLAWRFGGEKRAKLSKKWEVERMTLFHDRLGSVVDTAPGLSTVEFKEFWSKAQAIYKEVKSKHEKNNRRRRRA